MPERISNKLFERTLKSTSEQLGVKLDFCTHNSKGYGKLCLDIAEAGGVGPAVAGSDGDGIDKRGVMFVCDAISTLIERGYLLPTGRGRTV